MTRTVLVTGGSQGIGLAMARGLAQAGDEVTVLSRRPPPETSGLAHLACDLREAAAVDAALSGWLERDPRRVDVFVHCAVAYGSDSRRPLAECTVTEWDTAMAVNARSLLLALRLVLPRMQRRGGGTILGIASDVAFAPGPGRIPYAASKAASHAILGGLAVELADSPVRVLELAPLVQVDTPGLRRRRPPDFVPVGYAAPDIFVPPMLRLLAAAERYHGECLWVDLRGLLCRRDGQEVP